MAKLPKSIIKKYGISKKAWSVFKGKTQTTTRTRGTTMARRRSYSGKRKSYSKGSNLTLKELLVGVSAYAVARPYLAKFVPQGFMGTPAQYSQNIVLGGAGALASWKGKGMVKKAGTIIAVSEAFIAVSKLSSGMSSTSSANNSEYL